MTASTALSGFHQWLLAENAAPAGARSLMVHGEPGAALESLVSDVAEYLDEYDDTCESRWLAATTELVRHIAGDTANRRLLGLKPADDDSPADVLRAMRSRGHFVAAAPAAVDPGDGPDDVFHVGIGAGAGFAETCHLTLNPERIGTDCVAHIIGDVFLEWVSCRARETPPSNARP